ncbi:TPA: hypothetical protein ACKP39_003671 [Stenotrophomonas maltophilia]
MTTTSRDPLEKEWIAMLPGRMGGLFGLIKRLGEPQVKPQERSVSMQDILRRYFRSAAFLVLVGWSLSSGGASASGDSIVKNRCNEIVSRELKKLCGVPIARIIVDPEKLDSVEVETSGFMLYENDRGVVFYPGPDLPNRTDMYSCIIVWAEKETIDWGVVKRRHGVYFATVSGKVMLDASRKSCSAVIADAKVYDVAAVNLSK